MLENDSTIEFRANKEAVPPNIKGRVNIGAWEKFRENKLFHIAHVDSILTHSACASSSAILTAVLPKFSSFTSVSAPAASSSRTLAASPTEAALNSAVALTLVSCPVPYLETS